MTPNRFAQLAATMAGMLCLAGAAVAQQVPNAGAILRQLTPQEPALPVPKAQAGHRSAAAAPAGPRIHVRGFRIEGNTLIGTAKIEHLLAGYLDRDLSPADLQQATDLIARLYEGAGWLARALVPPQRVEDGVVLIQVIEGRFGEVVFAEGTDLTALHVSPQRIVDRVQDRLTPGQPLSVPDLTRGVLLAGDLPGISVSADETAGAGTGLTNVVLSVENQDLLSGQVSVDNFGQTSIGSERATAWLDFNSVAGFGEELGVLGILTPDLQFGRFSARLPLNDAGLSLDVNAAGLDYQVDAPGYRATAPYGSSTSAGADLEYQWLRATDRNLSVGVTGLRKNFYNDDLGGVVSDYHVYDALVFMNGNEYDDFGGGAVSTAQVSVGHGWVRMAGSPGASADRFGADTQGQFNVLRYRIDRNQRLWGPFSAFLAFAGQLSYQNLDPSEQFYLGGPAGVRAYPVASNGGSTGQLLSVELRWAGLTRPACSCGLKLLYDLGHIRLNANAGFPQAPQPNRYFLQGAGIGLYGTGPAGLAFSLTVVRKVGGDASAQIPDSGLTGARRDTRLWASLARQF